MVSLTRQYKREYSAWERMIRWCTDPTHESFHYYGGRGITVCPQWRASFAQFLQDVGPKPKQNRSIWLGRIDINGNYEPSNVMWTYCQRQIAHRRCCTRINLDGEEMTLDEANRKLGLSNSVLSRRLGRDGMDMEKALTPGPVRYQKNALLISFKGQTLSLPEWARQLGINQQTLRYRWDQKMPLEEMLQSGKVQRKKYKPRNKASTL